MPLWPRPADETAPPDLDEISREVHGFGRGRLPDWEAGYLEYHRRRYQDTLRLLPSGGGRRLLDVGSFPGPLGAGPGPRLGGDRAEQHDRGRRGLGRLPRPVRGPHDHDPRVRGRAGAVPAADGLHGRRPLLRALRAPPPEPVPHPQGDLPGPPPRGPPGAHHAQPPARRDALAALARLGDPAAGEPRVSRALPVPALSPAQPRVHGGRARPTTSRSRGRISTTSAWTASTTPTRSTLRTRSPGSSDAASGRASCA